MNEEVKNKFELGQVLLINKPLEWTSADVVRKIRNIIRIKKVGHAGTLDPLATGLLIVCTGKFTKKIQEFMDQEKEYSGTFTLGAVTPSYDLETEPANYQELTDIDEAKIRAATMQFIGEILQVPPIHSAIKKQGKRAYEFARKGQSIELEPRKITIREFEIRHIELPVVHFRVVCSTGTYIRSLANDFGQSLGCGAYLSSLCRMRIGSFTLDQSMSLAEAESFIRAELAK
ncbi:MAG: tRNA pseudouridine(55) synthase TruB [Bacteroidetes bacterium]|nr:MAG: tRNA pseudouridine(55) synthase TruB [Bacteroidota bacterium]